MAAAAAAAGGAGAGAGDGEVLRPQCITEINNVPTFSSLVIRQAGGDGGQQQQQQQQQQASVVIELEFEAARLDDGDNGAAAAAGAGGDDNNTANGARLMKFRGTAPVALADLDGSTTPIKLVLDRRDAENPAWDAHHPLFSAAAARVRLEYVRPAPAPVPAPEEPRRPSQLQFAADMGAMLNQYFHVVDSNLCCVKKHNGGGAWHTCFSRRLPHGRRYFFKVRIDEVSNSNHISLGFAADNLESLRPKNYNGAAGNAASLHIKGNAANNQIHQSIGVAGQWCRTDVAWRMPTNNCRGRFVGLFLDLDPQSTTYGTAQAGWSDQEPTLRLTGIFATGLCFGLPEEMPFRFTFSAMSNNDQISWRGFADSDIPQNIQASARVFEVPESSDF